MIYFISDGNCIKIGISETPWKRLAALQTAHHSRLELLAVSPGGAREEFELHGRFASHRLSGEWFRSNDQLLWHIERVRELYPDLQRPAPIEGGAQKQKGHPAVDIKKVVSQYDNFVRCGGVLNVLRTNTGNWALEFPGAFMDNGNHDPLTKFTVAYDDGGATPRIGREVKKRTLTDRFTEAMMLVLYFFPPSLVECGSRNGDGALAMIYPSGRKDNP